MNPLAKVQTRIVVAKCRRRFKLRGKYPTNTWRKRRQWRAVNNADISIPLAATKKRPEMWLL